MPIPTLARSIGALALAAALYAGCAGEAQPAPEAAADTATPGPSRTASAPARSTNPLRAAKPRAFGDVNRVNVVADPELLATPVGDSVQYYYEQAYPLMPQPEALYDVNYLTVEQLEALPARRELRTYLILADLNDPSSPTTQLVEADLGEEKVRAAREDVANGTSIVTDRWASDQLLVSLGGGALADRLGPARLLRLAYAPSLLGLSVLALVEARWAVPGFFALAGLTAGTESVAWPALWAARYGPRSLGAIKSSARVIGVVSTAAAPVAFSAGFGANPTAMLGGVVAYGGLAVGLLWSGGGRDGYVAHRANLRGPR